MPPVPKQKPENILVAAFTNFNEDYCIILTQELVAAERGHDIFALHTGNYSLNYGTNVHLREMPCSQTAESALYQRFYSEQKNFPVVTTVELNIPKMLEPGYQGQPDRAQLLVRDGHVHLFQEQAAALRLRSAELLLPLPYDEITASMARQLKIDPREKPLWQ